MSHLPEGYNPTVISFFVFVQFVINLTLNLDMGILPAASTTIKKELGLENSQFGYLGCVVYLGQAIGAICAPKLLEDLSPKWVLACCLSLNIVSLLVFTYVRNLYPLMATRVCTGLFQILFAIFMPCFAQVMGTEKQKSLWYMLATISNSLGIIAGYTLCAIIKDTLGWRWAFYTQIAFLGPCLIALLFIPSKYVDYGRVAEILSEEERKKLNASGSADGADPKESRLRSVLCNKGCMLIMGAITVIFYVVSAIQFWISDYFI